MACEYYGCMVFMERNKTGTWNTSSGEQRRVFRFEMDLQTGKLADKPGYYAQGESKNDLFAEIKDYIAFRGMRKIICCFLRNVEH